MRSNNAISIIVPTFNESENVSPLLERIDRSFEDSNIDYEVVFVDDHSQDGTTTKIHQFMNSEYRVRLFMKKGERGKASSLLQGFARAKYDTLCMIDADLQYPPEEIVPMYRMMQKANADMVLTERCEKATSPIRKLSSKVFNLIFARMMFGFNYDSQSGLKLFKKRVITAVNLDPTPWSFDLEFIVRALERNFKILSHKITFSERNAGEAKVKVLKVTYELMKASIRLRLNSSPAKIKRGYRRNRELARRVFGGASLVALLLAAPVISSHSWASYAAESRPEREDTKKSRSLDDYVQQLFQRNTTQPTQKQPTTPTPTPKPTAPAPPTVTTPAVPAAPAPKPAVSAPQPTASTVKPASSPTPQSTAVAQNTASIATYSVHKDEPKTTPAYQQSNDPGITKNSNVVPIVGGLAGGSGLLAVATSQRFKSLIGRRHA